MNIWEVWLWVKLSALSNFFDWFAFLFSILGAITLIFLIPAHITWRGECDQSSESYKNFIKSQKAIFLRLSNLKKYFIPLTGIFILLSIFTPTTKEFAVIYLVPKIVNNEQIQGIASDGLQCMKKQMEAWLNEKLPINKENK